MANFRCVDFTLFIGTICVKLIDELLGGMGCCVRYDKDINNVRTPSGREIISSVPNMKHESFHWQHSSMNFRV
jgi:hypothetical protein